MASGFPSGSDLTRSSNGGPDSSGTAPPPVATKVRKPYTITKVRERGTEEEHERFLAALKLYGRAWRKIEAYIGTKSAVQIRSHAQKFFSKLQRESERANAAGGDGSDSGVTVIPPARPKRKPAHPYPRKAPDPATSASGAATAANGNASAFDNAASNVAANLASLGAPGNAAAANFAAALASFAGTSAWGHAGNATAGNPRREPFAAAFHPGNPFNPYAVNTVANPLAAGRLRYRRRLRSTEARKRRRRRRRRKRRRRNTFARRSPRSAARNQRRPRTSRSRRRTPNVPSPPSPTETHKGRAIYSTRCSRLRRRRVGGARTVAKRGRGRSLLLNRRVGIHGLDGRIGGATSASLPATAAPGAAVQPTADQLALAMMLYGYAGAAGFLPPDSSGWDSSGDSSKGGGRRNRRRRETSARRARRKRRAKPR